PEGLYFAKNLPKNRRAGSVETAGVLLWWEGRKSHRLQAGSCWRIGDTMSASPEVLCGGIVVADHVCAPISHVPAAGELVMADKMLLTLGGCAANAAVDLAKMGVRSAVVGRVGGDVFGRVVADMLDGHGVDVSCLKISPA